jgi:AcrR family transcriptional regulator
MNTSRTYTMGARALAVEQTRQRILDALFELGTQRLYSELSLDDIAAAAEVSVQTVLRQFGSRAGLMEAGIAHAIAKVAHEREAPVGDPEGAVRVIVDHYEKRGRNALMMLAQESSDPAVGELTARGRRMHHLWVETVFAPYLAGDDDLARLLVVATDVYTWKLLRLDRGLSRARTEAHLLRMVRALLPAEGKDGS